VATFDPSGASTERSRNAPLDFQRPAEFNVVHGSLQVLVTWGVVDVEVASRAIVVARRHVVVVTIIETRIIDKQSERRVAWRYLRMMRSRSTSERARQPATGVLIRPLTSASADSGHSLEDASRNSISASTRPECRPLTHQRRTARRLTPRSNGSSKLLTPASPKEPGTHSR